MNLRARCRFASPWRRRMDQSVRGVIALLVPLLALSACTSPQYKAAPKKTPPPVLLNLPSTEPPVEALLHTVIFYRGPGSWKQDAFWDEYVVTVANRGNALVEIESAHLTDFQSQATVAGNDPWELERISRSLTEQWTGFLKGTVVQVGGGVGVLAVGGGIGATVFAGTAFIGSAGGAAIGGVLLLPTVIAGTIYSNMSNRHAIEREFERRRLVLPVRLVPGQLVQGSLFFRISPGPQVLTLKCRIDNEPREVVIDLSPLARLHFK